MGGHIEHGLMLMFMLQITHKRLRACVWVCLHVCDFMCMCFNVYVRSTCVIICVCACPQVITLSRTTVVVRGNRARYNYHTTVTVEIKVSATQQ